MTKSVLVVAAMATLFVSNTFAADAVPNRSKHYGFAADADLEAGGDEIASVRYTNNTDQSIKAGGGLGVGIGMHFRPANSSFDIKATVGYKFDSTHASNADITMSRTMFKLSAMYDPNGKWWAGIGPVWHTNVKFDGDGFVPNVEFDDAVGVNVQAGWKWIALSYTSMEYKFRTVTVDASSIGASFIYRY